jgi:purine-nucleoside phosphorylase
LGSDTSQFLSLKERERDINLILPIEIPDIPNMDTQKDFTSYRKAAAYIFERLKAHYGDSPSHHSPLVGVICGSGLSNLSHTLTGNTLTIRYSDIPGFPSHCSVPGHEGEIVFGLLGSSDKSHTNFNGVFAAVFRGRFHGYEGFDMDTVVLPTRVMRCLGVKLLLVTNAAGGLNPDYRVGDIVVVMDHIAIPILAGSKNPLIGPNDDELGPRFPATSNAYDPVLQRVVVEAAKECNLDQALRTDGTYCFVSGPMYESKKECRFLRMIGGDAVGMSTGETLNVIVNPMIRSLRITYS